MTVYYRPIVNVVVWFVFWIAAWRVFYCPFGRRRINYIDGFSLTAAYFLGLTAVAAFIFRATLLPLAGTFTRTSIIVLAGTTAVQLAVYFLSRKYLRKPQTMIDRHPLEFFLKFDYRYLTSKAFEVLFQQAMIAALILTIHQVTDNLMGTIIMYIAVFALAHIPMMKLFGGQAKSFARFYVAAAVASGLIFPLLILNVDGGIVYAYAVHSFFYTFLAAVFWIKNTFADAD